MANKSTFEELEQKIFQLEKENLELKKGNERYRLLEEELKNLQAQLHNAMEIAHLGYWEYDVANDLFIFNDPFYKIFRTTANKVGSYSMSSAEYAERFVHPDDRDVVGIEIRKAIESPDPHFTRQLEHRISYDDGTVGHINVRFFIVKDTHGKTVRTYGVNQDVTERKRAEDALREREELFRDTFEQAAVGMSIVSPEGEWVQVNQRLCDILGYSREELMKLSYRDITTPESLEQDVERVNEMVSGVRSANSWEKRYICKDRRIIWVRLTTALARSEDGRPKYFISVTEDITDNKQAEEEKKRLEARIQQAQKFESIGTLAGGVAHDFNNILSPIMIHTELVMMELPSESPLQQNMKQIYRASERARDLVQQILTFARQREQERIPIKITRILKEAIKLLRSTLPTTIDIQDGIYSEQDTVLADPTQIHQILINLCTNASHSMEEKGGILEVGLRNVECGMQTDASEVDEKTPADLEPGRYLKLTVKDTGHGIEPQLFELVLTDMTMPEMTGKDLARELMSIRPDIPVILCTGFSEKIDEKRAKKMGISAFLMKPMIMSQLANTVREVLDKKDNSVRERA